MVLLLHAPLNESAAPVVITTPTLSGGTRNFAVQGTPDYAADPNGITFDGTTDGLYVGENVLSSSIRNSLHSGSRPFSMYVKCTPADATLAHGAGEYYVQRWGWYGGYLAVYRIGNSGYVKFGFHDSSGNAYFVETFYSGIAGSTIEAVGTYDRVQLVLSSRLTYTATHNQVASQTAIPFWGGDGTSANGWGVGVNGPFANARWQGVIDDARLWNHALTQAEKDAFFPIRPPVVQLTSPFGGATLKHPLPRLSFYYRAPDTNQGITFTGELSQDPAFLTGVIPIVGLNATTPVQLGNVTTRPSKPLSASGLWYWRMTGTDNQSGLSTTSPTESFVFQPKLFLGDSIVGLRRGDSHVNLLKVGEQEIY